ncbi:hypothetical protein BMS3Abin09_00490 [bacterium BMS3Abin09]|nr:hypothetical protein BMS3Abin09_00490 [bacterium BMS3Abin09]
MFLCLHHIEHLPPCFLAGVSFRAYFLYFKMLPENVFRMNIRIYLYDAVCGQERKPFIIHVREEHQHIIKRLLPCLVQPLLLHFLLERKSSLITVMPVRDKDVLVGHLLFYLLHQRTVRDLPEAVRDIVPDISLYEWFFFRNIFKYGRCHLFCTAVKGPYGACVCVAYAQNVQPVGFRL